MAKKKKWITEYVPWSLGVIGGITESLAFHEPGILSALLGLATPRALKFPIAQQGIDSLLKYRKPKHVCAFYDLATALDQND